MGWGKKYADGENGKEKCGERCEAEDVEKDGAVPGASKVLTKYLLIE
jgi:hypothetical protein